MLAFIERLFVRYLNWYWGRQQPQPQPPVPWTRNTAYVGLQAFEVPDGPPVAEE